MQQEQTQNQPQSQPPVSTKKKLLKPSSKAIILGHFAMFMSTLFFGLNIPITKELIPDWLSYVDITLFRIFGGTILFWITSIFIKDSKIEKKDWWLLIFGGIVGLFSFLFFFALAIDLTSPIDLSIIMTLPPIMVVIISAIIFKTKISKKKILGIAIALIGALIIILSQGHSHSASKGLKGDIFAIISALSYSIYLLAIKRPAEKYKSVTVLRWVFLFSCFPAIFFSTHLFKAMIFHDIEFKPIAFASFVVLFPTYLSYLLVPIAIRKIGHELVAMYQYLVPLIASIAAILMKLAVLHWIQPIAAGVIIYGVYLTSRAQNMPPAKPKPGPPMPPAPDHPEV